MRPMVLVTGACGNVGAATVAELVDRGFRVRALDLPSKANRAVAAGFSARVDRCWGSITDRELLGRALGGVDHVLHLAAVIPPATDADQLAAYAVNVGGMRSLLDAAASSATPPGLTFTSTAQVYGRNADATGPRSVDEEPHPEDNYSRQKVECEALVRASGLRWTVFRLGMTPPVALVPIIPFVFELHPETRVEFTHPRDVAVALAATVGNEAVVGKTLNVAGGADKRALYRDWLNESLAVMGVAPLPVEAFGDRRFYTDWLDTDESQALLGYQQRYYSDYLDDIRGLLGPRLAVIRAAAPVVRRFILANSPYAAGADARRPVVAARGQAARARRATAAVGPWLSDYRTHLTRRR